MKIDSACLKMDMGTYVQAAQIHAAFNLAALDMREPEAVAIVVAKAADMIHESLPFLKNGYDLYTGDPYTVDPVLTAEKIKACAEAPKAGDGAGDIQIVVSTQTEQKLNDIAVAFDIARMKQTLRGVVHTFLSYQDGCARNGGTPILWSEEKPLKALNTNYIGPRRS